MGPVALYKFIERRHLDAFFATGSLRLGTLHGYRDTVEFIGARGDASEGKHRIARHVAGALELRGDREEPIISEILTIAPESRLTIEGTFTFDVGRSTADAFAFCSSTIYGESLFARWFDELKLDACYEIVDVRAFFLGIGRRIASSARLVAATAVHYRSAALDYRHPLAQWPGFTKDEGYAWQCEHRAIWAPLYPSPPLRRWDIEVPAAMAFCRPHAYMIDGKVRYF